MTYRDGVEEYQRGNYFAAFATFRRLADQGDGPSQYALAEMYFVGDGVPQNYSAAAAWFRRAANQGDARAHYNLAELSVRGLGAARSEIDAYMRYSLSAVLATAEEQKSLAVAHRDQTALRMSETARAEARRRACDWWRTFRPTPPEGKLTGCVKE